MSHKVYVIPDNGNGIPVELPEWDGVSNLVIRIAAFAKDAVIEVEP